MTTTNKTYYLFLFTWHSLWGAFGLSLSVWVNDQPFHPVMLIVPPTIGFFATLFTWYIQHKK